jgi:hypothetical protein
VYSVSPCRWSCRADSGVATESLGSAVTLAHHPHAPPLLRGYVSKHQSQIDDVLMLASSQELKYESQPLMLPQYQVGSTQVTLRPSCIQALPTTRTIPLVRNANPLQQRLFPIVMQAYVLPTLTKHLPFAHSPCALYARDAVTSKCQTKPKPSWPSSGTLTRRPKRH